MARQFQQVYRSTLAVIAQGNRSNPAMNDFEARYVLALGGID